MFSHKTHVHPKNQELANILYMRIIKAPHLVSFFDTPFFLLDYKNRPVAQCLNTLYHTDRSTQ